MRMGADGYNDGDGKYVHTKDGSDNASGDDNGNGDGRRRQQHTWGLS